MQSGNHTTLDPWRLLPVPCLPLLSLRPALLVSDSYGIPPDPHEDTGSPLVTLSFAPHSPLPNYVRFVSPSHIMYVPCTPLSCRSLYKYVGVGTRLAIRLSPWTRILFPSLPRRLT